MWDTGRGRGRGKGRGRERGRESVCEDDVGIVKERKQCNIPVVITNAIGRERDVEPRREKEMYRPGERNRCALVLRKRHPVGWGEK